jgi:uncharacterized protein
VSLAVLAGLAATVVLAAFVQGCAGVGFALITAPVAALVFPRLLPAGLLVLMLPLNGYVAWRERGAVDRSGGAWITGGRVVGTAGGLWLLSAVSAQHLNTLVGAATLFAVLATILAPSFKPGRRAFVTAGVVTGITETATGVGGPPLALVYQHHPGPTLRSTIAVCFLAGEAMSLALLAATGRVGPDQLAAAGLLLPALGLGSAMSRRFHHRLDGRVLRAVVLAFALASAIAVLVRPN